MEFMPTKGIEYLIAIGYLLLLVPVWRLALAEREAPRPAVNRAGARAAMRSWFHVPDGFHFHRGHAWAVPEGDGLFRVGIDEFAERLLGRPDAVTVPAVGEAVQQGAPGVSLKLDGHAVRVLSPVAGEVVEANPEVQQDPAVLTDDPYGRGWLFKVRVPDAPAALSNLLSGPLARAWMDDAAAGLSRMMGPALGPVLQDGGVPVAGFARELSPHEWPRIAAQLLLTD